MTRLAVLADDFTGATDIAGLCVRRGARVSLTIGRSSDPDADAEVTVRAEKIRTVPAEDAIAAARAFADCSRQSGATRLYWKYCSTFDSTPLGNIGPVADALIAELGADAALHCPAFPENRRTVYKGRLFVGDEPLDESPMRDHPLTPMRDASLKRLLNPQVNGAVGLLTLETLRAGEARKTVETLVADGHRHIVADAIEDADLERLASAFADWPLLCGGSAFGAALLPARSDSKICHPIPEGPIVIFSGSCSAATQGQVAEWNADGGPVLTIRPDELLAEGAGPACVWLAGSIGDKPVMITATTSPGELEEIRSRLGAKRAAELVETAIAELAKTARQHNAAAFIVAGGETSGAVASALGIDSMEVGPEIAPGVPCCMANDSNGSIALILKSGNFGGPDFFFRCVKFLKGQT